MKIKSKNDLFIDVIGFIGVKYIIDLKYQRSE